MHVLVLPIRFGFSRPVELPQRHREYYHKLVTAFFPDGADGKVTLGAGRTLPIVSERSLSADSVTHILHKAFDYQQPDYLLIDLGGPDEKDVSRPNVLAGTVRAARSFRAKRAGLKVGILLPQAVAANDLLAPALRNLAEDVDIRLLTGDGDAWGSFFESNPPNIEDIGRWTDHARANPIENLKTKLIRRVGQYRFPPAGKIIRHLYDGRYAHGEIYELLANWLAERSRHGKIREVAYDAAHSPWFRAPVEAALRDTGLLAVGNSIESPRDAARADIILLPIVRTGTSIRQILHHRKRGISHPRIWAALSTTGELDSGELRLPLVEGAPTSPTTMIEYALKVSPGAAVADVAFWENSRISAIEPDQEDWATEFTSDAMWGMIFESGVIQEENVPEHRDPVGYVPNFGQIAKLNGSLIAAKVDALLQRKFPESLPPSIAFLCPKENHATLLAESLRGLAGHDTIHVERPIIEAYQAQGPNVDPTTLLDPHGTLEKLGNWRQLARRVAGIERPLLVLLDEFHSSGRTFVGLYNLASAFQLPVLCSVSLASYELPEPVLPVPHLALYKFGRLN